MFKLGSKRQTETVVPISYYENYMNQKTNKLQTALKDFEISLSIMNFLENANLDYDYNNSEYNKVKNDLRSLKSSDENIFISFLGITKNRDCVDNFGHSRMLRTTCDDNKEEYNLLKRPWYIEALNTSKEISLSTPYLAESGSYVISVLRKIYNTENQLVGILGIDVLFSSIAKLKNGDNIVIFMNNGTILYNSHPKLKYLIEKQNNILYMINYPLFKRMLEEHQGLVNDTFCSNIQDIEFTKLFDERFVLLKTEKTKIKHTG